MGGRESLDDDDGGGFSGWGVHRREKGEIQ